MEAESYLKWIRNKIGPEIYIIVPDTKFYQELLIRLNDEFIILKYPGMDLTRYSRVINKDLIKEDGCKF